MRAGLGAPLKAALSCLFALIVAACGQGTPSLSPPGRIVVTVERDPAANPLFEPHHWARAISLDGSVVASWRTEGGVPVEFPPGPYRLEAFTVYLGDTLVCGEPIGGGPGGTCFQPTLEPGVACGMDIEVVSGVDVRAVYREGVDRPCQLRAEPAAPT